MAGAYQKGAAYVFSNVTAPSQTTNPSSTSTADNARIGVILAIVAACLVAVALFFAYLQVTGRLTGLCTRSPAATKDQEQQQARVSEFGTMPAAAAATAYREPLL